MWQIFSIGKFGDAIWKFLNDSGIQSNHVVLKNECELLIPSNLSGVLFIANYQSISLLRQLDVEVHKQSIPFIPVILDSPLLVVGPVIIPGNEGCYHCYHQRIMQHHPNAELTRSVQQHYNDQQIEGVQGYHPADVILIGSLLKKIVESPELFQGKFFLLNEVTRELNCSSVTGVHNCPRCGLQRDEATRGYLGLAQHLRIENGLIAEEV
ncbi:bacteriocin biosynthesis cyclodehydratase domain-containing protein [Paenibacillus sp. DS2015]|uniref:TOMM precursor leader peptide-binding protein n=1 Tax=Paenibacillus sp. DS2015 TaxID=3373917 RepID=UPI003D2163DA